MQLDEALKRVAVLGAAGKMGRGISALLLQEMALLQQGSRLLLIDTNEEAFLGLKEYLHEQVLKFAEKNIVRIRGLYANKADLVSNEEIIQDFVEKALNLVFIESDLEAARGAHLIFEAVVEEVDAKAKLLARLKGPETLFLTNTSSIP